MEPLIDPLGDRVLKSKSPPPHRPLPHNLLFPLAEAPPSLSVLKPHLEKEGKILKQDLLEILSKVSTLFKREPNLVYMNDPVTVVGDIHGQFYDLLRILEVGGDPSSRNFLFLGDYVDRGSFSLEVLILLFSFKINFPESICMLRGNHECRQLTTYFNFRNECLEKYDLEVYEKVMDTFDCLPLACILNQRFLAVHGGLSPELRTLDDFAKIYRYLEPPSKGLFCDLLWSDPIDSPEGKQASTFTSNQVRGCSFYYGADAVNEFVFNNDLIAVIRAHEAQLDGYKMHKWNGPREFPLVITLFSAPNYCDVYNNKGAIIMFDNNTLNIQQYTYTPHPYLLPDFMDIFNWSVPFIIEKTNEIVDFVLRKSEDDPEIVIGEYSKQLMQDLREKRAVQYSKKTENREENESSRGEVKRRSRMSRTLKELTEENEFIVRLKDLGPRDKKTKKLSLSRSALYGAIEDFQQAKTVDTVNEKRPA